MDRGVAYGVGVGPGDPELMTLKAVRVVRACSVVAVPGRVATESLAYQIALAAVPELAEKELIALPSPMVQDRARVKEAQQTNARTLESSLDEGKDVACLTLGDPSIYSTFCYLREALDHDGYAVEIVCGVPSFCAAAARVGISLAEWDEGLHVLPVNHALRSEDLSAPGNYVLMKAGGHLNEVRDLLGERGMEALAVERCGLDGERVYRGVKSIPRSAGYLTTVMARSH